MRNGKAIRKTTPNCHSSASNTPPSNVSSRIDVEDDDINNLIDSHISNDDDSTYGNPSGPSKNGTRHKQPQTSSTQHKFIQNKNRSSTSGFEKKPNSVNSFSFSHLMNRHRRLSSKSSEDGFEDIDVNRTDGVVLKSQNSCVPAEARPNSPPGQMKTKLRSIWNNVKYGWRMKREVNLKVDAATWILGKCYHNKHYAEDPQLNEHLSQQLKLDILSKVWLTYRTNFPAIPGTTLISDSGWGCMLRCGQMMMAQALVSHFLHRDWRIYTKQSVGEQLLHKRILRWFGDSLSENSPFSLHHLVSLGENYGRKAGDWYGPTHVAQVLRDALIIGKRDHPELRSLCMYVALDGIVFKQDILDLCQSRCSGSPKPTAETNQMRASQLDSSLPGGFQEIDQDEAEANQMSYVDGCPSYSQFGPPSFSTVEQTWDSLILFVSVRLGNDRINPFYVPCLKSILAYEHCVGIVGGRPKHALYFIGWQDDKLIHLDPHACQPAVDVDKEGFSERSFHSSSVRTMSFSEMDPSCAIGFYFRKQEDYLGFIDKFSEITASPKRNLDYPVFALTEGRRSDIEDADYSRFTHTRSSFSQTGNKYCADDDEDFFLL